MFSSHPACSQAAHSAFTSCSQGLPCLPVNTMNCFPSVTHPSILYILCHGLILCLLTEGQLDLLIPDFLPPHCSHSKQILLMNLCIVWYYRACGSIPTPTSSPGTYESTSSLRISSPHCLSESHIVWSFVPGCVAERQSFTPVCH